MPELAAVLKAATGFRPSAVCTPRTSAAPRVRPLAVPPEAVRHDSDATPEASRAQLLPSWSSVPISVPLSPTR